MSDIASLESRLSAALDRIAAGLDTVGAPAAADHSEEIAALQSALEEERTANAQLEERLKAVSAELEEAKSQVSEAPAEVSGDVADLKAAHAAEIEALQAAAAEERRAWEGLNSRLVRMRRSNKLMRTNTVALRQAAADMVVDPNLINQSLQVELDAQQAAFELEQAEADVILKTLQPLIGDPENDVNEELDDA